MSTEETRKKALEARRLKEEKKKAEEAEKAAALKKAYQDTSVLKEKEAKKQFIKERKNIFSKFKQNLEQMKAMDAEDIFDILVIIPVKKKNKSFSYIIQQESLNDLYNISINGNSHSKIRNMYEKLKDNNLDYL